MWKIDDDGNAFNERGEKIWLIMSPYGHLEIRRTELVETKKWRGFTKKMVASFPKNYSEDNAREFLFHHVDYLNLKPQYPPEKTREFFRELDARKKDRKKLKMFSLWT